MMQDPLADVQRDRCNVPYVNLQRLNRFQPCDQIREQLEGTTGLSHQALGRVHLRLELHCHIQQGSSHVLVELPLAFRLYLMCKSKLQVMKVQAHFGDDQSHHHQCAFRPHAKLPEHHLSSSIRGVCVMAKQSARDRVVLVSRQ